MQDNLTVEQKFAKILLNMRDIRPFYSAVYEVINKRESDTIDTMGVTTNELIYNRAFVDNSPISSLIFVVLHEIAHIALKHVARRENRDPVLWNTACDLYVNAALSKEFNITPGGSTTVNGIKIIMPVGALFVSTIDIDQDYVEAIYDGLLQQSRSNGYKTQGKGKFTVGDSKSARQFSYLEVELSRDPNNNKYGGNDLCDTGADPEVKNQESDKIVTSALVRVEMSGHNAGDTPGGLLSIVREMLKSYVDWRTLLKRYLTKALTSDSSFSNPDKRMYYTKAIYPGQLQDGETLLKNIKICIDTSGSISDTDLQYFFGQVYDLAEQFKMEAELIYWDAAVQSVGSFKDYKEFTRIEVVGRGGTDPSVIFDYFDSNKCKVKPVVTLIFTDGYFSVDGITPKQRRKYKDTIWLMTKEHNKTFEAPFGKKTVAKYTD